MKNTNSPLQKMKEKLKARWSAEDYPGGELRFQIALFGKDVAVYLGLPIISVILFKACEGPSTQKKRTPTAQQSNRTETETKSQIIDFRTKIGTSSLSGIAKRTPGTLVKVKLLNVVETYSNAPVHAQIIDTGLGRNLLGGTLIGDAISDTNFERINITFRYVRDPAREGVAVAMNARALSLDGTLGLIASKKEGFLTRSVIGSGNSAAQNVQGNSTGDFKEILFRALTAGLVQEFGSSAQVEKNRAQVLTLKPSMEFFAELTDFFPGSGK